MKNTTKALMALSVIGLTTSPVLAAGGLGGAKLFNNECKLCHSIEKNTVGPSLVSMNKDASVLRDVITNGSTKKKIMSAYGKKFSAEQIDSLVRYIKSVQ